MYLISSLKFLPVSSIWGIITGRSRWEQSLYDMVVDQIVPIQKFESKVAEWDFGNFYWKSHPVKIIYWEMISENRSLIYSHYRVGFLITFANIYKHWDTTSTES